jgi:hypothetical protein
MALPQLPENAYSVIVDALRGDDAALTEFSDGLSKRLHFVSLDPSEYELTKLMQYLEQWYADARLATSPLWRHQVAESERVIADGKALEGVTTDELRKLVHG